MYFMQIRILHCYYFVMFIIPTLITTWRSSLIRSCLLTYKAHNCMSYMPLAVHEGHSTKHGEVNILSGCHILSGDYWLSHASVAMSCQCFPQNIFKTNISIFNLVIIQTLMSILLRGLNVFNWMVVWPFCSKGTNSLQSIDMAAYLDH